MKQGVPAGIDPKLIVESRTDASGEAEPRLDALHVYGVDLLTTADILSHFHSYAPGCIEWLNDSSCNVCFPDKFTVKRAIVQMGEALTDAEREENRSGMLTRPSSSFSIVQSHAGSNQQVAGNCSTSLLASCHVVCIELEVPHTIAVPCPRNVQADSAQQIAAKHATAGVVCSTR